MAEPVGLTKRPWVSSEAQERGERPGLAALPPVAGRSWWRVHPFTCYRSVRALFLLDSALLVCVFLGVCSFH